MSDTTKPGAHGATRIDLAQYRHAIREAPELIHHLAHLVVKGRYQDGQPTARDMQAAPGRLSPLDEAEAVFAWLYREAAAWIGHAQLDTHPIGHMVRRDDQMRVIGSRWIITSEHGADGITADARTLVGIIMQAWPTIETVYSSPHNWGVTVGEQWASSVDEHLLKPLARWPRTERAAVPERARQCPACGEREVWTAGVDLDQTIATCARCEQVIQSEAWATTDDAAQILHVSERTIRNLITAGIPNRKRAGRREVEVGAARLELQARNARKLLNIQPRLSG